MSTRRHVYSEAPLVLCITWHRIAWCRITSPTLPRIFPPDENYVWLTVGTFELKLCTYPSLGPSKVWIATVVGWLWGVKSLLHKRHFVTGGAKRYLRVHPSFLLKASSKGYIKLDSWRLELVKLTVSSPLESFFLTSVILNSFCTVSSNFFWTFGRRGGRIFLKWRYSNQTSLGAAPESK